MGPAYACIFSKIYIEHNRLRQENKKTKFTILSKTMLKFKNIPKLCQIYKMLELILLIGW